MSNLPKILAKKILDNDNLQQDEEAEIDYAKVENVNKQLLDKTNKNIIVFLQKLVDYHHQILDDIVDYDFNLNLNKIHIYNSGTVEDRNYYIITLSYNPDSVSEIMFLTLYKDQKVLDPSKNYFIENNTYSIVEMLCFIFAEEDMKFKIYEKLTTTPGKSQILIILEKYTKIAHSSRIKRNNKMNPRQV